jgi:predicted ABC-type ATPase
MDSIQQFLKAARDGGYAVWLAYGQVEVTGYVLDVTRPVTTVQDKATGQLHRVATAAIEEAVEA